MAKCPLCKSFIVLIRNIINYEKGIGMFVKQIYECEKGHKKGVFKNVRNNK